MATTFGIRARLLARVAAPVLLAAALNACSSMPDWIDPTTWIGGGDQAPVDESANAGGDSAGTVVGQTPDLADIPAKPAAASTPEEQKQVADSLAADRADAHYSAEALRGGTEPTAPPPPPAVANAVSGNSAASAPGVAESDAETASPAEPGADNSSATAATKIESASAEPPPGATESSGATEAPVPTQVANTEPAAPVSAPPAAQMVPAGSPDMQATFAPSRAPALDPSVAQYVPAQVLSQYRATAAEAASPGIASDEGTSPSKHRRHHRKKTSLLFRDRGQHVASRWGYERRRTAEADGQSAGIFPLS